MAEDNKQVRRLSKVAKELNVGISTIVEYLNKKGKGIDSSPNTKVSDDIFELLLNEFQSEKSVKEKSNQMVIGISSKKQTITINEDEVDTSSNDDDEPAELLIKNVNVIVDERIEERPKLESNIKVLGKIDLNAHKKPIIKEPSKEVIAKPIEKVIEAEIPVKPVEKPVEVKPIEDKLTLVDDSKDSVNIKVLGKMDLESLKPKKTKSKAEKEKIEEEIKVKAKTEEIIEDKVETKAIVEAQIEVEIEDKIKKSKSSVKDEENIVENESIIDAPADIIELDGDIELDEAALNPDGNPENFIKTQYQKLDGPTILGRIVLPDKKEKDDKKKQPVASSSASFEHGKKKKRKRIKKDGVVQTGTNPQTQGQNQGQNQGGGAQGQQKPNQAAQNQQRQQQGFGKPTNQGGTGSALPLNPQNRFSKDRKKPNTKLPEKPKVAPTEEDIQKQIRETLARLSGAGKSKASKHRRLKRDSVSQHMQEQLEREEGEKSVLKVTEFVTANELAIMMNVQVTKIIATCMSLGLFVSINQRLDAETLTIVAEEFGFTTEFVSAEVQETSLEEADNEEDLVPRPPIVTVMGHVDHGKTSLLDYIRKTNVIAGEAGGITQHIGAYSVVLDNGKTITFLDTPGHEAFTAMRARGAQVTDIAIIVIAADDSVMPQTVEAINHAQAAGVPLVFAINKIDKPGANPEKIREALANMNILVEEWGGKYQCQEISAKKGLNIEVLLDKVLLEAEILELKGNSNKRAVGTVIESQLDKGRGYVATALIQTGAMRVGDPILAGCYYGKIRAMFNERGVPIEVAGPSTPVQILGLNGAPQAGDRLNMFADEKEAKTIATKRLQLQREQGIRTQKHITLDEIGRRIAIGDFKELNIIVKGDVDGSIEALTDSLLKLSTSKIQVNVIHKSVGAVSESDVLLASASNAIIIGFQVRPSLNAKKLAEKEEIDIRLYSIIYDAINEVRDAMEGMLAPEVQEKIVCNLEIREVFKITKVGTIAGCFVLDGKIMRNTKVRIIRDGIVVHTGTLGTLKRFKDEVKEAVVGQDCGLNINNFNDIKVGDIVEGYDEFEVKAKL